MGYSVWYIYYFSFVYGSATCCSWIANSIIIGYGLFCFSHGHWWIDDRLCSFRWNDRNVMGANCKNDCSFVGYILAISYGVFSLWLKISALIALVRQGTILGDQFFLPGQLYESPLELFSLQLALILGTAGLPHILIRFFTVKNTVEVRRSLISAAGIIGIFYIMTLLLGFGTIALIGYDVLISADATGNLAAPMLAREVGGDFLLAFISAIAFTTIVAVVAGLAISATTAFSHDVYHHIIKKGNSSEKHQLLAARWSAFGIGIIATLFALKLENIN